MFNGVVAHFPAEFGRNKECAIPLMSKVISRTHGKVSYEGGRFKVENIGGRNKMRTSKGEADVLFCDQVLQFSISDVEFVLEFEKQASAKIPDLAPDAETKPKIKIQQKPIYVGKLGEFDWELDQELLNGSNPEMAVQGAVTWGPHIFDVRNFCRGDDLRLSPDLQAEMSLPALDRPITLGKFNKLGAVFQFPPGVSWSMKRGGQPVSIQHLQAENRLSAGPATPLLLQRNEILTVYFSEEIKVHFRYISQPLPYFPRTWIENKEQFKKAIQISLGVHLFASIVSLLSATEIKAPEVENVPKRFARLLVEPPKVVLAPPPPPVEKEVVVVPPPPPPPPPPVVVEKPKPPPPKKVAVKKKPPAPVPAPVAKPSPTKVAVAPAPPPAAKPAAPAAKPAAPPAPIKTAPPPTPAVVPTPTITKTVSVPGPASRPAAPVAPPTPPEPPKPPPPTAAELEAAALAQLLQSTPGPGGDGAALSQNVKVSQNGGTGAGGIGSSANPGMKIGGIAGALPRQDGAVGSGLKGSGTGLKTQGSKTLAKVSDGNAGQRAVTGFVIETGVRGEVEQGLTKDTVMSVVNRNLTAIQNCYATALQGNATLAGSVEYEWTISAQGQIQRAVVKSSEMAGGDQSLNPCVLKVIRSMTFPAAPNSKPTVFAVRFPFGAR